MVASETRHLNSQRAYGAIKARIIAHEFKPGQRLMAETIAENLNFDETPVRESLTRLYGEGLIEMTDQEGYYLRPTSETEIRELYEFNHLLLDHSLSVNPNIAIAPEMLREPIRVANGAEVARPPCASTIVRITNDLFAHIAGQSGNTQIVRSVWKINDRLHRVRMLECEVLANSADQVLELCRLRYRDSNNGLAGALRTYHAKRICHLPDIMKAVRQ